MKKKDKPIISKKSVRNTESAVAILLLIIAFPVGLIFMWGFTKWSILAKLLITLIPAAILALIFFSGFKLGTIFA